MGLKQIKGKIRAVKKTHQVTKAMEAVSAVKMRKSQAEAFSARPYALAALSILKRLSGALDIERHPLLQKREVKKTLLMVITSDKGLAGSLNSAVLKKTNTYLLENALTRENTIFITIGRKAYEHFTKRGYTVENVTTLEKTITPEGLREMATSTLARYDLKEVDKAVVVYTNLISSFVQEAVVRTLLPLSRGDVNEIVEGIVPVKGKYSEFRGKGGIDSKDYLFEPSPEAVLDELIPLLLSISLYHALLEALASEHSARMVAMKNASDKAEEVTQELTLQFNKARQTLITREVSEIVGGVEAMK